MYDNLLIIKGCHCIAKSNESNARFLGAIRSLISQSRNAYNYGPSWVTLVGRCVMLLATLCNLIRDGNFCFEFKKKNEH